MWILSLTVRVSTVTKSSISETNHPSAILLQKSWDMQKIFLIVRPTEDSTWFEYQAANKILARKPFVEVY
jgi:hypothetical protein